MQSSNVLFRACDPKTLNLADGITWKSKKSRNSIIFKFYCPINNGYSAVRKRNRFFKQSFLYIFRRHQKEQNVKMINGLEKPLPVNLSNVLIGG